VEYVCKRKREMKERKRKGEREGQKARKSGGSREETEKKS